jgi:hypothetical protein
MRAALLALAVLIGGCVPGPGVDLEVRYTGISIADMHVRITSPGTNPSRWYFTKAARDDGTMGFLSEDILLRETIEFDVVEADEEDWDVLAWIDLQGDEDFICATDPLNAIECAPDLQDKQERFRFTLLAEEPTTVDVVIID